MLYRAIRSVVIMSCAALAMQAAATESERFEIPFAFQVQKETLPPGVYQVQQADGSNIATLVNKRTGERVEFIRPASTRQEGKARLVFENGEGRRLLKQIL
jgi:hypothetical protein